jgi:alcohol dehydrogenase class IV
LNEPWLAVDPARSFRWLDAERTIVFGRDALAHAAELIGPDCTLLTTPRALEAAPALAHHAQAVLHVGSGRVDELASALRNHITTELLVALGGGRVIDTAKALAAADPPRRVAAIPTTLSGAEMTGVHRHAAGVRAETPRVRPAIVLNDPQLSASQPPAELARSAANALGHAAEAMLTPLANPVATLAALQAARLIAEAFDSPSTTPQTHKDTLALAALLAGYAIGSAGYGLHHVAAQTLARFAEVSHGAANAVLLPYSLTALQRRFPDRIADLGRAVGGDPIALATRLARLGASSSLHELGVPEPQLTRLAQEAAARSELHLTPPAADEEELRMLYGAAY